MIIKLYEIAKSKEWKPWELQSVLKKEFEGVVAVGDDLSFTLKLNFEIPSVELEEFGGQKCKIYPFKNAYRFGKGFVAFNGNFLRISRNLSGEDLDRILDFLLTTE
ncbi:MAG: hypothetical protein NZ879_06770 [Archaeoglobaceae archaeon]|nr:hypothetical protein [Archaeoglobaceae archaeon]MDW8118668.1 hypothetical protein [Archaeoglobaceae archaeon]